MFTDKSVTSSFFISLLDRNSETNSGNVVCVSALFRFISRIHGRLPCSWFFKNQHASASVIRKKWSPQCQVPSAELMKSASARLNSGRLDSNSGRLVNDAAVASGNKCSIRFSRTWTRQLSPTEAALQRPPEFAPFLALNSMPRSDANAPEPIFSSPYHGSFLV